MVTTAGFYAEARYRAQVGEGLDGVVRLTSGSASSTGSLLYDGRAILTSAHFLPAQQNFISVIFETKSGLQSFSTNNFTRHPGYDALNSNNDLAIIWLNQPAPIHANRYQIYRDSNEIGQIFTLVGYGKTGTGNTGATVSLSPPARIKAQNEFDADASLLKSTLGSLIGWNPLPNTQLMADFDNGNSANDALGQLIGQRGLGLGLSEGLIASGDSGGPAFIDSKIAGVASYTASIKGFGSIAPDIDSQSNSSFGEVAAWQRVSHYQQWIDQTIRANFQQAPSSREQVKTSVIEGDFGTTVTYFLLEFTGVRENPNQILSVDYATRDGTAKAWSDFLPVSGTLNLYPGENQAVIPVEIIGDLIPEPEEYFYLDVFNPVGGSFGDGVATLTAIRTIIDNDGWLG